MCKVIIQSFFLSLHFEHGTFICLLLYANRCSQDIKCVLWDSDRTIKLYRRDVKCSHVAGKVTDNVYVVTFVYTYKQHTWHYNRLAHLFKNWKILIQLNASMRNFARFWEKWNQVDTASSKLLVLKTRLYISSLHDSSRFCWFTMSIIIDK